MKSRKLKAVLAAVSAVAVLATAMTGFAASVSTKTEYNYQSNYAKVTTTVSNLSKANAQVAIKVTTDGTGVNNSNILYIDQQEAVDNAATFTYYFKTDDSDFVGTPTEVDVFVGNDAGDIIAPSELNVKAAYTIAETSKYTINPSSAEYIGTETVDCEVVPVGDFQVDYVNYYNQQYTYGFNAIPFQFVDGDPKTGGYEFKVVTSEKAVTPGIDSSSVSLKAGEGRVVALLHLVGDYDEVGVKCGDYLYKSMASTDSRYVAIVINGVDAEFDTTTVVPYIKVGDSYLDKDGNALSANN